MPYILKDDIPTANLDPAARLYAGRGWLPLVREALDLTGDSIIMAIREDAGALRIELANATPEQRAALVEISQRSLTVCEVCGEPGLLRFEGVKAGIPAGWHRTRCDQHIDTRTSSGLEPSENVLVIDLEATCESHTSEGYHFQIIEIGAVWLSPSGEVLDTFETLVRADQPISEFCTGITTITQDLSDTGASFPEASAALAEFASRYPGKTWASWGAGDLTMIERDSVYHCVANPLEGWAHRNLKLEYHVAKPKMKKKEQHVGMKRALVELGIELEGVHHRALPDALNICKVFVERVRRESWKTDLPAREAARRKAIWKLEGDEKDQAAKMVLLEISNLDRDYPMGPAHSWTLAELAERVPHTPHPGSQSPTFFKVLESDIPEPWRARMNAVGLGAQRFPDAFYGVDWLSFLASWEIDTKRP